MISFMVTDTTKGAGGGFFSAPPAKTTPKAVKPVKSKKVKVKKVAKKVKPVSLLATRPKTKSQQLAVARSQANNYAVDLDRIGRDLESGKLQIDTKSITSPKTTDDQRAVLLRQAGKLARLSKQLELRIFNDKNNRLIYSLLNVYQQQAEVVDQIVKLSNLGGRAEKVVEKLIDPFSKEMATTLVGLVHTLSTALHDVVKEEEASKVRGILVAEIRKAGGELQKSRNDLVARVPHVLMDD